MSAPVDTTQMDFSVGPSMPAFRQQTQVRVQQTQVGEVFINNKDQAETLLVS